MRLYSRQFLLLICLGLFLAVPAFSLAAYSPHYNLERVFYMSELKEKEGIESLKQNADKIDILAPQMYGVSAALDLTGGLSDELKQIIKEKNLNVMPLVANYGFKQDIMHNLLLSELAQNNVIKAMIAEAKKENYIGWQFDFENINYKDKDLYSQLVERTAEAFKKEGLILSVAAVARYTDYEDTNFYRNWSGVFDYARIAKVVDFISIMTYDDPSSLGPAASAPFVEKCLAYLKGKVPADKLSMGVPLYYWAWSLNPLQKVVSSGVFSKAIQIMSNFFNISGFDQSLGTPWYVYMYKNTIYMVWYENAQSFKTKLNIAKENNLRGVSAWVLGIEDPAIWQLPGMGYQSYTLVK